jgi:hypothetical protein
MASITTWSRLEPTVRSEDLADSLQARVHDPLWLLARQWQLGELAGEDAGTPAVARLEAEVAHIDRYKAGPADGEAPVRPLDDRSEPLEAVVERGNGNARGAANVQAGLHLHRMLRAAGLADVVPAFAVYVREPAGGSGTLGLLASRVPDAAALREDLHGLGPGGALPSRLAIPAARTGAVRDVLLVWRGWFDALVSVVAAPAEDAWNPERLEYEFSIGARLGGEQVTLHAAGYQGGRLDWHDFDLAADATLESNGESHRIVRTVIPAPVGYGGMPAARFWELEDGRIDFSGFDGAADDLVGLLLVEFALVYGNDWFLIPVDLPVGSLARIDALLVDDAFGVRTRVLPAGRADSGPHAWRMFTPAPDAGGALLFLPPALASSLDGPVRERVLLARDEIANLAWAIEEIVERSDGGTERREDDDVVGDVPDPPPEGADLVYRTTSPVPARWIPLAPAGDGNGAAHQLEVRALLRRVDGSLAPVLPRGALVQAGLRIHDEELGREGLRIERAFQFARWRGGRSVAWSAHRREIGRGAAYGGLFFDRTVGRERPPSA